jgi:hypothetical protein
MRLLLATLIASAASYPAVRSWTAGEPPKAEGLSAVRSQDADFQIQSIGAEQFAAIAPVKDYYQRAAFVLRTDQPAAGRAWLVIRHLDRGYGLISVETAGGAHAVRGSARLNTGKVRSAVFAMDHPGSEIRLRGVAYVQSVELTETEPGLEVIPAVEPAFRLRRPMDLVISAGADANKIEGLPAALAAMREQIPLARALGFQGIESYVKWNFVERTPGVFDWSFYDAVTGELEKYGMRWFPLLIVGSAYALPDWFHNSAEMHGYACLEHGVTIDIPTIFNDAQVKYVRRFLAEFGKHYGSRNVLLGVRLGPSANYGEAQYPATGDWGYRWGQIHTHIGYWAGDRDASAVFRKWAQARYDTIASLNAAWYTRYTGFDEVKPFLPMTAQSPRMRADFATWYMDAMSDWCEKWATWAREALPNKPVYQSSGGWGAVEIGTDYTAQARSMAKLHGGIRLTNENDSYLNNICGTRMAASAARFYGAKLGFEPAGFGSARSVMARLYNALTNGADHLFYYGGNITDNDQAPALWVEHAPKLDQRAKPATEIAVFYPDTANKLSDDVLRYRLASAFFERVQALRAVTDFDFASEQMILDNALDRYKVLVFLWGRVAEKPVLQQISKWVEAGGTILYPGRQQAREGLLNSVEGDAPLGQAWREGRTGKGRVIFFEGYAEPSRHYISFVRATLRGLPQLRREVHDALQIETPYEVYWSVLENGKLALLNYDDHEAAVRLAGGRTITLKPYTLAIE